jgi:hypothetical protein
LSSAGGKLSGSCRCWIEQVITRHLVVAKNTPISEIASPKEKAGLAGKRIGHFFFGLDF